MKAICAKTLGPTLELASTLTSARPSALRSPHSWRIGPASLLGANSNPRWAPEGPLQRGLLPQRQGLGTPEPQHRTHPAAPLAHELLGVPPFIQGGRTGKAHHAHGDFQRPPAPKRWGSRSGLPARSPGPVLHSAHSRRFGPASLLGANPDPRLAPERPLPRGLAPQCQGLGTPEPQRGTHPAAPPPPKPLGAPPVIQGGRKGRALRAAPDLRPSKAPAQTSLGYCSGSPAPSPQPNTPGAAQPRIGPAGLLEANPNPRPAPEGPIPRSLALQRWGLGTLEPHTGLTLPPCHHLGR